MIVVSNTSPVTNLAAIGQFELLRLLYEEVHIPSAVCDELNAESRSWPGRDEVAAAPWVVRHSAGNQTLVTALTGDLDRGEAECIALALELGADLTLLDEKDGRHAAQRLGLRVLGVVGVLLEAKAKGALKTVRPQLDALRQIAGFYVSGQLYQAVLALAGEETS